MLVLFILQLDTKYLEGFFFLIELKEKFNISQSWSWSQMYFVSTLEEGDSVLHKW